MKKTFIIIIMTASLLTLVSCNSTDIEVADSATVTVATETTEIELFETTNSDVPRQVNGKWNVRDAIVTGDSVTYDLENAYYNEAGEIVIEGNLVNVSSHDDVGSIRLVKLELFNENNEIIASNAFGYMPYGTKLDSGEKMSYTYTFPAINVLIKDDDLDLVKPVSRFSTKH